MGSVSTSERSTRDFSRLYLVGSRFERGALHVRPVEDIDDPYAIARGEVVLGGTLTFERSSGSTPRDLVTTEYPPMRLLSHRAITVLQTERATGWRSHAVQVLEADRKPIDGYALLVTTGRSGPIDNGRSIQMSRVPPPGGKAFQVWKGLYFDEESWDGSDVFCIREGAQIVVTGRIKEAFERAKVTNVTFTALSDVERMESEL